MKKMKNLIKHIKSFFRNELTFILRNDSCKESSQYINKYQRLDMEKIMKISSVFLCYCFFHNIVNCIDWMESLTRYLELSPFRQVTFVTRLVGNEKLSSPTFDEICTKLMQNLPALRLNIVGTLEKRNASMFYDITDYSIKFDVTANFFVIVHESLENLPILPPLKLFDYVSRLSVYQYRPTYLLLFLNRIPSDSFEDLLTYAWSKKIYDLTIVELPESEVPKDIIKRMNKLRVTPIVHQLNGFKGEYKKIAWSPATEWFPNKVADMAGHVLRITAIDAPPFSIARFNEFHEPINVEGASVDLMELMAQKMKASVQYLPLELGSQSKSGNARVLHTFIKSQQIDLQGYLSPHYTANIRDRILRTKTIMTDYWCPVVPILPIKHTPMSLKFFGSFILSLVIIIIFGLMRCLLKIEKTSMWKPFNLTRLLFAIPVSCKPNTKVERIVFLCLIVLSMAYSNMIFTSITEISLMENAEMEFRTFEDIDRAGLTPVVTTLTFNKTFFNPDSALMNLRNKSIRARFKMYQCPNLAARHKNLTCLMSKRESVFAMISLQKRHGRNKIKIAEACFWSDGRAFLTGPGSPYRHEFDKIISRLRDSGLIQKLYEYKFNNLTDYQDGDYFEAEPSGDRQNMILLRQRLLSIMCFGYSLAVCAFIAEILIFRFWRKKPKNRIPKIRIRMG